MKNTYHFPPFDFIMILQLSQTCLLYLFCCTRQMMKMPAGLCFFEFQAYLSVAILKVKTNPYLTVLGLLKSIIRLLITINN
jgi:hypothetical protein